MLPPVGLPPANLSRRSAPRAGGRAALVRHWLTRTFSGRAIVAGALVKVVAFILALAFGTAPWVEFVDTCGDLSIIVGALIIIVLLFADMKQQLLWRIRRKLAVSYIFMGFVPVLLVIVFFLTAGLLLFFNIGGYMMRAELTRLVDHTRFAAESAAQGVAREQTPSGVRAALQIRQAVLASRYPGVSIALLPAGGRCGSPSGPSTAPLEAAAIGPWRHLSAPTSVPGWMPCEGFSGLLEFSDAGMTRLVARTVAWPTRGGHAVVVDVPVDAAFNRELRERAGLTLGDVSISIPGQTMLETANLGFTGDAGLRSMTPVDSVNWENGAAVDLVARFQMSLQDIYDRITLRDVPRQFDPGRVLLVGLALVGTMFLIIQGVAFAMGLALARSITGSVHELFAGTERVRRGDFAGRVSIRSRDQLGELAESFNSMTASIEDLLQQKAEKERMEQELRIARNIQMSLLPQGPLVMPGITLTAHCEPAREVGGDYYDFLPIDDHTLGILVADVSGKGTSAALYMAELKGIVLSLSQRHRSPRDLLIEADHIISRHLDSRSFITVTYLVVDLRAGTLQYARAGHCPLVYVPGPYASQRAPQLLAPDGLVLGLQLDQGRSFVRLLEELTVPLGRGDLFVLYTDGLTEAMSNEGECFGDSRLASLIGQHADLPADELRERILRDIDAFTGSAPQQDDMTMVVLRIEEVGQGLLAPAMAAHADT